MLNFFYIQPKIASNKRGEIVYCKKNWGTWDGEFVEKLSLPTLSKNKLVDDNR